MRSHLRGEKNKRSLSSLFADFPICSDKAITALTHESWSEQPETALHCKKQCLINHSEKITASFLSLQPAPPLATAQSDHRTSCRKYQTLTSPPMQQAAAFLQLAVVITPLGKTPGSTT